MDGYLSNKPDNFVDDPENFTCYGDTKHNKLRS
jgi:hypothetical protein